MSVSAPLAELLACPACGTRLTGASCLTCRIDFPSLGNIPWLMPEPQLALTEWRGRLHYLLTHYAAEASRQRSALAALRNGGQTRARLELLAAAFDDQSARIRKLMQPLGIERRSEAHAVHVALGTELPLNQGLSTYYANLHRDWCWGDAENRASLETILACVPEKSAPLRVLVLGAGACRLAYDLHNALRPRLTAALDINPLFLLAAEQILSSTALELYEFPIAPRTIADNALLRRHAAPKPVAPGFELILADASAPPFRSGCFDLVLTPWFIDVAGEPIDRVVARINNLLAPRGSWVNHGSLTFADSAPADAPSLEELLESLPSQGFERAVTQEVSMPYLCSPASRHGRQESVITFCARKERDAAPVPLGRVLPDWLVRMDLPVPVLPQFRAQALSMRVYAFLLAMIDGERAIHDMARLMEQQRLMTAEDAEPAIRRFLARALQDADRRPQF